MSNKRLIVLAKSAPPAVCGMSDYSYNVANSLTAFYESVEVAVAEVPSTAGANRSLPVKSWKEVFKKIDTSTNPVDILINYTPASYSKWSLPVGLIFELRKLKRKNPGNRVFIHFHEVWNGNPNLKIHHAITDKLIKWSVTQLVKLADGVAVFTVEQEKKLKDAFGLKDIHYNLIGSSILPTAKEDGLKSNRTAGDWIVFGLPHTRLWTVKANVEVLKELYRNGRLKRILAVGPSSGAIAEQEQAFISRELGKDVLVQLGALSPADVTRELLSAEAALVGQSVDSLRKSSTFATLAAHAIPVICNIPKDLLTPPGEAIFRPDEILNNSDIVLEEGSRRGKLLHHWFWNFHSWEAISADTKGWIG
jgi:hypothetical protein